VFFYPPITYLLTRNPPGPRVNSLGSILVAATNKGVCTILFGDDSNTLVRDLQNRFPKAQLIGGDTDFEHVVAKVVSFADAQALQRAPGRLDGGYTDIAQRIGASK
jgi:AraC family transcriptional regulator of adaptative response/methylated-DNA-[protein]-cysteine methyltransferase